MATVVCVVACRAAWGRERRLSRACSRGRALAPTPEHQCRASKHDRHRVPELAPLHYCSRSAAARGRAGRAGRCSRRANKAPRAGRDRAVARCKPAPRAARAQSSGRGRQSPLARLARSPKMPPKRVFVGHVIHSASLSELVVQEAAVVVDEESGRILDVSAPEPQGYSAPEYSVHVLKVPRQPPARRRARHGGAAAARHAAPSLHRRRRTGQPIHHPRLHRHPRPRASGAAGSGASGGLRQTAPRRRRSQRGRPRAAALSARPCLPPRLPARPAQYKFTGTGTDLPLFSWLDTYTFPTESGMRQLEEARLCYGRLIDRLLANGTTTAVGRRARSWLQAGAPAAAPVLATGCRARRLPCSRRPARSHRRCAKAAALDRCPPAAPPRSAPPHPGRCTTPRWTPSPPSCSWTCCTRRASARSWARCRAPPGGPCMRAHLSRCRSAPAPQHPLAGPPARPAAPHPPCLALARPRRCPWTATRPRATFAARRRTWPRRARWWRTWRPRAARASCPASCRASSPPARPS
jgi:hypothetical protein